MKDSPSVATLPDDNDAVQSAIVDEIVGFLRRFVFLKKKSHYVLIALWILSTYLREAFDYAAYLFIHSPEKQCGKTRLLEVISELIHNSSGILISPTEAVLFRTAEDKTQLLDEVDSWQNKEQLRSVLNAGFQKGGTVPRLERTARGKFMPRNFNVYGPRALAGIGMNILDGTTRDRTFIIEMVRRNKQEPIEKFRRRRLVNELSKLRQSIERWVQDNREAVCIRYEGEFRYLESFSDRTVDVTEPLAAILETACPEEDREVLNDFLEAIAYTRKEQQPETFYHLILKRLLEQARLQDPLIGNATELAALCGDSPQPLSAHEVSAMLRRYGFSTKSIRREDGPKYRYEVTQRELEELCERYACVGSPDTQSPDDW